MQCLRIELLYALQRRGNKVVYLPSPKWWDGWIQLLLPGPVARVGTGATGAESETKHPPGHPPCFAVLGLPVKCSQKPGFMIES